MWWSPPPSRPCPAAWRRYPRPLRRSSAAAPRPAADRARAHPRAGTPSSRFPGIRDRGLAGCLFPPRKTGSPGGRRRRPQRPVPQGERGWKEAEGSLLALSLSCACVQVSASRGKGYRCVVRYSAGFGGATQNPGTFGDGRIHQDLRESLERVSRPLVRQHRPRRGPRLQPRRGEGGHVPPRRPDRRGRGRGGPGDRRRHRLFPGEAVRLPLHPVAAGPARRHGRAA